MVKTSACPNCHQENPSDYTTCARCGTPLVALLPSRTTSHLPVQKPQTAVPARVLELTRLYSDLIVFQVMGYDQLILARMNQGQITIGRYSPGEAAPSVDLAPFNGSQLGVSRQHACIAREQDRYAVFDLGSTNGTWLNEVRLDTGASTLLNTGDVLRIGQIQLGVFFKIGPIGEDSLVRLVLKPQFGAQTPFDLTPFVLQTLLLPYLQSLERLEHYWRKLYNDNQVSISLRELTTYADKGHVVVKISNLVFSLRMIRGPLARWREMHSETLQAHWITPVNTSAISLSQPVRDDLLELIHDAIRETAPQSNTVESKALAESWLMDVQTIATSPLRLLPDYVE